MDAGLLPGPHTDGHAVFYIADRIGLGIFQRNQRHQQIAYSCVGNLFVPGRTLCQQVRRDLRVVAALLKGNAEDLLGLLFLRNIIRIHLHYEVSAFPFAFKDLQGFFRIAGGNDAVGNFPFQQQGRFFVADIGQGGKVAVGRHTVRPTGGSVGGRNGSQFQIIYKVDLLQGVAQLCGHCGAGRAYVFKGSRSR